MLIELTRIDGSKININPFQIEMVEKKNNTVIRMMNEVMYIVLEDPYEIENKIKEKIRNIISSSIGGKNG
ncbi:MAG: flagellar FlbD family protein [Spirochaetia bacterium]|nr:flagellar FlbD family protein [Spirochaetota bacterium]MCX8095887.1 flagellar FlbD family protein [Spirochaetota bacterium]MDW8112586.1 flagellar FlbD family protein [Spirochaetia bacterium]